MNVDKKLLNKVKIWWTLAYEHGDTEKFNECEEFVYNLVGKHIEVWRYKKYGKKWEDLKMNTLCYIPEHYCNTNGILEYYYSKDDIVRLCRENKVVAKHVYSKLKGERVEDYVTELLNKYYEFYTKEAEADLYVTPLGVNVVRIMDEDKREEVFKIMNKKTGRRYE